MTSPGSAERPAGLDDVPVWLRPVTDALGDLRAEHLTGFAPPPGARPRAGAVLMAFAAGERGPELLLTERAHHMRSLLYVGLLQDICHDCTLPPPPPPKC